MASGTLTKFLQNLANETVVVDTKQETSVSGTVVGVDASMNIHLKNVKIENKKAAKGKNGEVRAQQMDNLTLRGNTVRLIILPDHIPLETYLAKTESDNKPAGGKRRRTG